MATTPTVKSGDPTSATVSTNSQKMNTAATATNAIWRVLAFKGMNESLNSRTARPEAAESARAKPVR